MLLLVCEAVITASTMFLAFYVWDRIAAPFDGGKGKKK